jgi:hypothetical protein
MSSIRKLVAAALSCLSAIAMAQSPYQVSGLHTDLVFTDAVAQVEKLGGDCRISAVSAEEGGTSAECDFLQCPEGNQVDACKGRDTQTPGLAIAAQPVLRIGLEAPETAARVTRIVVLFEGTTAPVAEALTQQFGLPDNHGAIPEKSWSHSRRQSWTQGIYRMGLLNDPNLIILAADRASRAPAPGDSTDSTGQPDPAP